MRPECPTCHVQFSYVYLYGSTDPRELVEEVKRAYGKKHSVTCVFCGAQFTFIPRLTRSWRNLWRLKFEAVETTQERKGLVRTEGIIAEQRRLTHGL